MINQSLNSSFITNTGEPISMNDIKLKEKHDSYQPISSNTNQQRYLMPVWDHVPSGYELAAVQNPYFAQELYTRLLNRQPIDAILDRNFLGGTNGKMNVFEPFSDLNPQVKAERENSLLQDSEYQMLNEELQQQNRDFREFIKQDNQSTSKTIKNSFTFFGIGTCIFAVSKLVPIFFKCPKAVLSILKFSPVALKLMALAFILYAIFQFFQWIGKQIIENRFKRRIQSIKKRINELKAQYGLGRNTQMSEYEYADLSKLRNRLFNDIQYPNYMPSMPNNTVYGRPINTVNGGYLPNQQPYIPNQKPYISNQYQANPNSQNNQNQNNNQNINSTNGGKAPTVPSSQNNNDINSTNGGVPTNTNNKNKTEKPKGKKKYKDKINKKKLKKDKKLNTTNNGNINESIIATKTNITDKNLEDSKKKKKKKKKEKKAQNILKDKKKHSIKNKNKKQKNLDINIKQGNIIAAPSDNIPNAEKKKKKKKKKKSSIAK